MYINQEISTLEIITLKSSNNYCSLRMNSLCITFVVLASVLVAVTKVEGHGYLAEPPNRSSMWRYGFNTPINYNDNEHFCGGFSVSIKI